MKTYRTEDLLDPDFVDREIRRIELERDDLSAAKRASGDHSKELNKAQVENFRWFLHLKEQVSKATGRG